MLAPEVLQNPDRPSVKPRNIDYGNCRVLYFYMFTSVDYGRYAAFVYVFNYCVMCIFGVLMFMCLGIL